MKKTSMLLLSINTILLSLALSSPALSAEQNNTSNTRKMVADLISKNSHQLQITRSAQSMYYADYNFNKIDRQALTELVGESFLSKRPEVCQAELNDSWDHESENDSEEALACTPENRLSFSVEEGESDNYEYSFDEKNDTFVIRHKYNKNEEMERRNRVDQDLIQKWAEEDIGKILKDNLKNIELTISGVEVTELRQSGEMRKQLVAHTAHVKHRINGMRILNHRMVLIYFPDGRFQKSMMKWPEITQKEHQLRETQNDSEIIERVYEKIKDHPLADNNDEELEVEPALRVAPDGSLYQVLMVSGHLKANFGKSFRSVLEVRI
jgi:hypothetical protein